MNGRGSAIRHHTADDDLSYPASALLGVLEKKPVHTTRNVNAGFSTVATADVQPQPQGQQFTPRNVKLYKKVQQPVDTDGDIPIDRNDLQQSRRTTAPQQSMAVRKPTSPQSMVARKQSALKNRVEDRRTGDYPLAQPLHRQREAGRFTIRRVFQLAREGSWPILIGLMMMLILLGYMVWAANNSIAHWNADNQYKASGSTHGAMVVAYLGDGDSKEKPDTAWVLLQHGQVLLITGNTPAKMHIYPGPFLAEQNMGTEQNMAISDEITLSVFIVDSNHDGHADVQVTATDWTHLGETLTLTFFNDGKGGFKGGN